ncbi:orotidine-5'-phosphate decarboxylase [Thiotrichales bacterium 19S3-7]|nr:orotidine-5'-phosphate decarboxylase [Thiotrichales bacterium 19S3-7]MCF6802307.1 orotidine-5'-phosphate decarboxylase [Thiotrichales bacterium 19S3-11]
MTNSATEDVVLHPVLNKLNQIIHSKKTNLSLSADVTTADALISLVEQTQDHICVLKTHIDILEDFSFSVVKKLRQLADQYEFLIFEDRKFADIGNTVAHQLRDGIYHIAQWADMINAHILPGEGIISGLKKAASGRDIGLLLLAQMSSSNNYFTEAYTQAAVHLAKKHRDFVIGFIAQEKLTTDNLVVMTPGVQMAVASDQLGQQYNTPETAILEHGSDIIIVGRGIYQSERPKEAALRYQKKAFAAYSKRYQANYSKY